ncbi:MAG TPA: PaaI family thioesterase [Candidatus Angelobacter sp.]|jgi:uncharacterized protein (TIGR00369 family)|nr:PaaI family thioesterase [Candidatus Angelobacter sp.]
MKNQIESADLQTLMSAGVAYWRTLGLELKEVTPGRAVFECEVRESLMQMRGIVHGGVLASIVDSACAVAAISTVYPRANATTISLRVSYLKPLSQGIFRAEGKCIKTGKTICFCEAQVFNERNELVCTASSELMIVAS